MKLKAELLKDHIIDIIIHRLDILEINADEVANTTAINILSEIIEVIKNEKIVRNQQT